MQKVYHHKDCRVSQIIDLSGKKPLEDIKKEFGNYDYQCIDLYDDEVIILENNILGKIKIIDNEPPPLPPGKSLEEKIAEEVTKQLASR